MNLTTSRRLSRTAILAALALMPLSASAQDITRPGRALPPDASGTLAASEVKETTISSNGTARVERTPDYVDISVGVSIISKTASEAQAEANKAMDAALKAIRALNLPDLELQTGTVQLTPRYDEYRPSNGLEVRQIVAYDASIMVRVRTSDLKAVPKTIDAALSAGCNRVDYVSFGIREAIAAREEAIKLAVQAARRKAAVLAEALDLEITSVETATTTSQMGGWYPRYGQMAQMSNRMGGESGGAGGEEPVVPGKVEVWADANITFTAKPAGGAAKKP
ncbi:MAG TPA: SIMPL domain-containing protein [Phycisphaerales bacterium]|nr:SIMPL domain-containing protein [Phycisphaerales bacterium]